MNAALESLKELCESQGFEGFVRMDEPLSRHTSLGIGGPAAAWVQVDGIHSLGRVVKLCEGQKLPWTLVGQGCNLLVSDEGFAGAVLHLGGAFKNWNFCEESNSYTVGAAVSLSRIVQDAFRHGYSGMEFAVGTPGTMGGALRMNAGTACEWLGSRVLSVTSYKPGAGLCHYCGSQVSWEYRGSSLPKDEILLECELAVEPGRVSAIRAKMEAALSKRQRSQPLEQPSCGSVFRNPEGQFAARLIEDVGLKGATAGGAMISPKHANFIVNTGGARAVDVLSLMREAMDRVEERHGIVLKPEVRFLGF